MSRYTDKIIRGAERLRIRRESDLALNLTCRFCGAEAGQRCRGPRQRVYLPTTPAHYERRRDAVAAKMASERAAS